MTGNLHPVHATVAHRIDNVTTGGHNTRMKAVGIKQLKARLSEYVRLVRTGETILVTDRDEVVAELRPATGAIPRPGSVEETLDALAAAGLVTRARLPKRSRTWHLPGLGLPAGTALRLLDAVRADRV